VPDILEQLQAPHGYFGRAMRHEAACEIARLREAIGTLKMVIRQNNPEKRRTIADELTASYMAGYERGKEEARKALGES